MQCVDDAAYFTVSALLKLIRIYKLEVESEKRAELACWLEKTQLSMFIAKRVSGVGHCNNCRTSGSRISPHGNKSERGLTFGWFDFARNQLGSSNCLPILHTFFCNKKGLEKFNSTETSEPNHSQHWFNIWNIFWFFNLITDVSWGEGLSGPT
jgi:hypothetical protein